MPLIIDEGRIPNPLTERSPVASHDHATHCVTVALINNMPDPALEDTQLQFAELLAGASENIPVHLELFSLPELPRGDRARQYLTNYYGHIQDLLSRRFDGVIVTGTEPRQPDLRRETYWPALRQVLEWAEHNTSSAVLSCLAAHAGVLYSDGIERSRLGDKQFGVFRYKRLENHPLTDGLPDLVKFPHSRWNEVREETLSSCGYAILTRSSGAGVDLFVKEKGDSLFLHFQGHPEYGVCTLLKEYRRDIKRFFKGERQTYPSMPSEYFDAATARVLADFKERALSQRDEELLTQFPEAGIVTSLENSWQSSARCVYRNWLRYLASRKADQSGFAAVSETGGGVILSADHPNGSRL